MVTTAPLAVAVNDGRVRRMAAPVRYLANLLFSMALTFLGLTCVTFFIGRVIPIDPVLAIVGDKASIETYNRVKIEIGLDQPIPVQYWRFLGKVMQGDFGNSVITARPVLESTATLIEMNPPSPSTSRSESVDSPTSPTESPST